MSYYLRKCLKLYVSQTRQLSRYLILTVNVSSQGLVSVLTSIVSLQDPLQYQRVSLGCIVVGSSLSRKKGRLAKMTTLLCHSLLFLVTCCHSISLGVSRCITRCQQLYHSLSFVVTCCTTRCHSLLLALSLDVSLACLFINDSSGRVSFRNIIN